MKKHLVTIICLLCCSQLLVAQNLVTNGSFEQHIDCPSTLDQLYKATGWQNGSSATADYFNSCDTGHFTSVPKNRIGYQQAYEGNAYAGIVVYEQNSEDYTEYLRGTVQPLIPGHSYQVSLKVSRANICYLASNGIAAYFYVDNIGVNNPMITSHFPLQPQLDFQNYSCITDSLGWTTLIDTLVADSAYKYIVLGRFIDTSELDTLRISNGIPYNFAYYYIDDVRVFDLNEETNSIASIGRINDIKLSPNPFVNTTTLSFSNPEKKAHTLFMYNIEGRLIKKLENIRSGAATISRDGMNAGCYFYELVREDGAAAKGKLFVQ